MTDPKLGRDLRAAQQTVVVRLADASWLRSVGIGLVGEDPGVIVSVAAEGESEARGELEALRLPVPTSVRVIGPVRARRRTPSRR